MGSVIKYIKSDLYRYYGRKDSLTMLKAMLFNRSFKYSFWLRACQSNNKVVKLISIFMHRFFSTRYGIHISIKTKIGYGFYIGHGMGVVISPSAVIGNNCNVSPFTNIGSNYNKAAKIGDNVYIGPHVSIVENVVIGNNVTIGAGAVVVKNIGDNMTSVGNPNKSYPSKNIAEFIKNKYEE